MPRVLLLHTGGTLGMAGGRPSALRPAAFFKTLRKRAPELFQLADIELELFCNVDSSEMQPELWSRMAAHLHQRLSHFDGAVVTHGTDTLAHTASALSFMLRNPPCPVVLTGSQRPLGEIRSDARLNLIDAVLSALQGPREVTICFDSHLYRGNRTRKVKVAEYDAFESPNFPVLGTLGVDATFEPGLKARGPFRLFERLDSRVFLLKVYPGLDPALPLQLLPHVKGFVVEAYGAGNFPIDPELGRSLRPLFTQARERGVPVLVVSQAHRNGVDLSLYESGAAALAEGAVGAADMTPSAALVKLMQGLAYHPNSPEALTRFLQTPVAGELTVGRLTVPPPSPARRRNARSARAK
ncbi:L-asparaginase 1 [Corallococcus sp. H22C18031201]|uniref:asparaginase n=1 Tax=Citreicoccus inhibens TaxID=2849499 RepID=UPI000E70E4F5|nr:asparaginase [Citreicoccus inhibens]MBU8898379.1 asparaginase [Citreicoccus inhibens]RJS15422.1 L-asparaginase 1 [Corallococcus sp. H22C18031201]